MPKIAELISGQTRRQIEDAVAQQRAGRKQVFVPLRFKADEGEDEDGRIWFEGMANVATVDRTGDRIDPRAFAKSLKLFLKYNPQMFYMHDWYLSVGRFTEGEVRENGLWVRGYVAPAVDDEGERLEGYHGDFLRTIRGQVKRGELRTLSIGFRPLERKPGKGIDGVTGKERDISVITQLELLEISLVTVPASRESVIQVRSFLAEQHGDEIAESLVSVTEPGEPDPIDEPEDDTARAFARALELVLANPERGRTVIAQITKALEGGDDTNDDPGPDAGDRHLELVTLGDIEATGLELVTLEPTKGDEER